MNGKLAMLTYLVRSRDGGIVEVMGLGNLIALLFYPNIRVYGVYVSGCIFRVVVHTHARTHTHTHTHTQTKVVLHIPMLFT